MNNNPETFFHNRERRLARSLCIGAFASVFALGFMSSHASAEKPKAAKTEHYVNPQSAKTGESSLSNDGLIDLAAVQESHINQAQQEYFTLVSTEAAKIAEQKENFNPEIASVILSVESGFGTGESASGNLGGIKCVDDHPHSGCGPMVKTLEQRGDKLVEEYHRFQKLPGNTLQEKVRSSLLRFSELMDKPQFADAAYFKDNPDLFLSGLENQIDHDGNITVYQGAEGSNNKPLVLSYATYAEYVPLIQHYRDLTNSRKVFAPYYQQL